jgi:argininosuccinate lyase
MSRRSWGGLFSEPPAPEAHALGRSVHVDVRLAPQDIKAGVAHTHALRGAGLLSREEAADLEGALLEVGLDISGGTLVFEDADEDIHSVVERAVTERLGDLGARLHAGRSRNDLVVTDLRLWLLEASNRVGAAVSRLAGSLVGRAREHAATVMPGTTHGRNAQPVTLGHHLLAHAWALHRDLERLEAWAERSATSPLGAGALATSTLGVDPAAEAHELGFRRAFENSIDAVSDRDFVLEFLAVAGILAAHVGRLAADVARWTDPVLGWAELDDAYATGSSMMPQKRNPDTAELARAKVTRVSGAFAHLAAVIGPLPLGYHRDLQEDKEPAFDAVDTLELVLPALTGALETLRFNPPAMRAALSDEGLYATDLAEALVADGVPFREAHRRTGELIKASEEAGTRLRDLSPERWRAFGLPDGPSLLNADHAVAARKAPGGPSPASVLSQADTLEKTLAGRG